MDICFHPTISHENGCRLEKQLNIGPVNRARSKMADYQKQEKDKMAVVDNHKGDGGKRSDISIDQVDKSAVIAMQRKLNTEVFPKKKSSFQITSVTTSLRGRRVERDLTGDDHDGDSLDDLELDESHTDDISSSDILDMSKTTDIDPDPSSDQDAFQNLTEGGEIVKSEAQSQRNESIQNLKTVVQANLSRFKVVKIESKEPFKRGRWKCLDFLDPHEKGEGGKVEDVGSGNSSNASSIHYVPGVDDPSKNPLLEIGSNIITENHQIVEPLPVYANQLKDNAKGDYDYANSQQQHQQSVQDISQNHQQSMIIKSDQNGHIVHNSPEISHPPVPSKSQEYMVHSSEYMGSKGQAIQTNSNDQVLGIASVVPNPSHGLTDQIQSVMEGLVHGMQNLRQEAITAPGQDHQAQISLSRLTSPDQQHQHSQPAAIMTVYQGDMSQLPEHISENYVALENEPGTLNHHNLQNEFNVASSDYQTPQVSSEYQGVQQIHNPYTLQSDFQTHQHLAADFQSQAPHFTNEFPVQTQQHLPSEYQSHSDLSQGQTDLLACQTADHQKVTGGSVAVNSSIVDPVHTVDAGPEQQPVSSNTKSSPDDHSTQLVKEDAGKIFHPEDKLVYGSRPDSISIQEKSTDSDNSRAKDSAAQTLLEFVSASIQPSIASPAKDEGSESGASTVAIDNKIEQAMDLVKSHLMYAVREEVEVLKEQIKELIEKNSQLEAENAMLKNAASAETLARLSKLQSKPSHTPTTATT